MDEICADDSIDSSAVSDSHKRPNRRKILAHEYLEKVATAIPVPGHPSVRAYPPDTGTWQNLSMWLETSGDNFHAISKFFHTDKLKNPARLPVQGMF